MPDTASCDAIDGYAAAAPELIARFDAVDSDVLYAPVRDLLPTAPVRVADVGAGTGRDAAWLDALGHHVVAVEPVAALRRAGRARTRAGTVEWLDDRLPWLDRITALGPFDLVLVCAVWQHLDDGARAIAMPRLADLTSAGGSMILSLRHGPGAASRPVHPISVPATLALAAAAGFATSRCVDAGSVQPGNRDAGVRWTWLALTRPAPRA